ncbi:MAG: cytochrome c family protein [Aquisalinus sp.]|nr:cytochrome c family protein [Aquisalinus sp.]
MNSAVNQDEYVIWRDRDPHARAWRTLQTEDARNIASYFGIEDPANSGKCLGCHTTEVGPGGHETAFDIRNGISCEACHGAASEWLGVHSAGLYFYAKNISAGMFPTADPESRAEMCVSCHVGTPDRYITHEMMAAGHRAPSFQMNFHTWFKPDSVDTYTDYAHFDIDDDYLQRKPVPFGLKALLVGEIVQWRQFLTIIETEYSEMHGIFPELAFFDCYSCHFQAYDAGGPVVAGPGVRAMSALPLLADHNYFVIDLSAEVLVDVPLARRIGEARNKMRQAVFRSPEAVEQAAGEVIVLLTGLLRDLEGYRFSREDELRLLDELARQTEAGGLVDYMPAKQALYATASIVDGLWRRDAISQERYDAASNALKKGLEDDDDLDARNSIVLQQAIIQSVQMLEIDTEAQF